MGHTFYMYLRSALALVLLAPFLAQGQVGLNVDVENAVRAAFAESPVMIDIARCESKFRQYTDSGNPLYGGYAGKMVGVFQIYSDVHASFARSMGMDIEALNGNLAYANYLYEREGTKPWMSSFPCWGSESGNEMNDTASGGITINLSLGMEHPEVRRLQELLNTKGFTIASEGPGSPGMETEKYGSLTRNAVRRFQCAQMQLCDGDEYSNGYGYVGAKTRAALVTAGEVAKGKGTTGSSQNSEYSETDLKKIEELRAQIADLNRVLSELLQKQGTNATT